MLPPAPSGLRLPVHIARSRPKQAIRVRDRLSAAAPEPLVSAVAPSEVLEATTGLLMRLPSASRLLHLRGWRVCRSPVPSMQVGRGIGRRMPNGDLRADNCDHELCV